MALGDLVTALPAHLASGSSSNVPLLAIATAFAAILGGLGGLLTASSTRSRGATEGFRDLTTDLQQERDLVVAENREFRAEIDRLRTLLWTNHIDWRPPAGPPPGGP